MVLTLISLNLKQENMLDNSLLVMGNIRQSIAVGDQL